MNDRNRFEFRTKGHNEWLTPKHITDTLGPFDLDPCSPINRPWDTAARHYTIEDDGYTKEWNGVVWLNPPYGKETGRWMKRLKEHGNGIALIFARTETNCFFDNVFYDASGLLFIKGRLKFYNVDGTEGHDNAGVPSVLISYGEECAARLLAASFGPIRGRFIDLRAS